MSFCSKGAIFYFLLICLFPAIGFSSDQPFEPFTGKVSRNKVRLRLTPDLEGKVVNEVQKDQLLIVVGESEDFYMIQPLENMKAYIFRTFVLGGVVEGSRVNVRLEPTLDSPIIAQLNSGDKVEGDVCQENNKWLVIKPPASVALYVFKDYVHKVGDIYYMSLVEERRKEINHLLNSAYLMSQEEMQKPFQEIDLDLIVSIIQEITTRYGDFPEHTKRAHDLMTLIQDHYLQQKSDYLEFKSKENSELWKEKNAQLLAEVELQRKRLQELEKQLLEEKAKEQHVAMDKPSETIQMPPPSTLQENLLTWMNVEQQLFKEWHEQNLEATLEDYYKFQIAQSKELSGILKAYDRVVKNKPGDFLIVNPVTQTPLAFLYSTSVDLEANLGKHVTVYGSPRPDNHFAFPAYYVHQLEPAIN